MSSSPGTPSPRVLYVGMPNRLSYAPLLALLEAGVAVCGVVAPAERPMGNKEAPIARVSPGHRSPLPIVNPYLTPGIVAVAWERGIPVFELARPGHPAAIATLAALRPDVGCVACFPQRIPPELLAVPPHGFLNLHPALLPARRGPAPLFWIFQSGGRDAGVTLHMMDEGLDTGDIVAQAALDLPGGISGSEAEGMCAELGARLLRDAIEALRRGPLPRRRQPEGGSAAPWPGAGDFALSVGWPARRAFNFMRGTAAWGHPYEVDVAGERLALATALACEDDRALGAPIMRIEREVLIQFSPGVLQARLA